MAQTNTSDSLGWWNIPPALIEPAVRACRLFNTAVDAVFYDTSALAEAGVVPPEGLDDPEGALLLIDAAARTIRHSADVTAFLAGQHTVSVATITGVGSSALGSAALAWDVSVALGEPVLAIVPGYGVADMVVQGLGGWFGFGLHDWLQTKSLVQTTLAAAAPAAARIGRALPATVPDPATLGDAPVFRTGSGSYDVLHALLLDPGTSFRLLVGHSKGALQIGNAIRSLPASRTQGLKVVTLGCPIREDVTGVHYCQSLGRYDALGQLNMWGNFPEHWPPTWHSTNPAFPAAMDAGATARAC